jgi:hypothetical protein
MSSTLLSLVLLISVEVKTTLEASEIYVAIVRRMLHEREGREDGAEIEIMSTDLTLSNGKPIAADKLAAVLPQHQKDGVSKMSRWPVAN